MYFGIGFLVAASSHRRHPPRPWPRGATDHAPVRGRDRCRCGNPGRQDQLRAEFAMSTHASNERRAAQDQEHSQLANSARRRRHQPLSLTGEKDRRHFRAGIARQALRDQLRARRRFPSRPAHARCRARAVRQQAELAKTDGRVWTSVQHCGCAEGRHHRLQDPVVPRQLSHPDACNLGLSAVMSTFCASQCWNARPTRHQFGEFGLLVGQRASASCMALVLTGEFVFGAAQLVAQRLVARSSPKMAAVFREFKA